jgi:hypothetical protein
MSCPNIKNSGVDILENTPPLQGGNISQRHSFFLGGGVSIKEKGRKEKGNER